VDLSDFRSGDWLIITGGAVMMIFGLTLKWASFGSIKLNIAFDYFLTGGIAWLLLVAAAIVTFLIASRLIPRGNVRWSLILLIATGAATALMLLRLILGAGEQGDQNLDRANGMYIAFLAAAVAFGGAISNYRDEQEPRED
jgi:hypothetical protein